MKGALALEDLHMWSSLRPYLTKGTTATKLKNAVIFIGFQGGRCQLATINHQRYSGPSYCNGEQHQNSMIHVDLWYWLGDHGFPRSKINAY